MASSGSARLEQFRQARRIHGGLLNMCAAGLGVRLARLPIPSRRLRERLYRTVYGQKYKALNEEELDRPLADFRSLNELFTRGVRTEFRPVSADSNQFVCPCDSTIQDLGRLQEDTLLTVKDIEYSLESLLPGMDTAALHNGAFAIFFLSPADCHRVFAPDAGEIREIVHVPGRRLLVHPPYQRKEFPVFSLNERVILRLSTTLGECVLVMVAGWGVGNITHPFDVRMRASGRRITRHQFEAPQRIERGEWIATFELGSTVILLTEPAAQIIPQIARDDQVLYGQPAFLISADDE
ncbi:MAG: archaetidylserine decarboxylase [Planctomycetota bacterium]|jgi:phosphatidylserine decarboxylase